MVVQKMVTEIIRCLMLVATGLNVFALIQSQRAYKRMKAAREYYVTAAAAFDEFLASHYEKDLTSNEK